MPAAETGSGADRLRLLPGCTRLSAMSRSNAVGASAGTHSSLVTALPLGDVRDRLTEVVSAPTRDLDRPPKKIAIARVEFIFRPPI